MATQGYGAVKSLASPSQLMSWARELKARLDQMLRGKVNVNVDFTLAANAATSTLTDPRIGKYSNIIPVPTSANASADFGGGAFYIGTPGDGTVTINHPNNANADKTVRATIIG